MPERMRWLKREEPAAERDVERLRHAVPYWPAQVAVLAAIGLQLLMPAKVTPGPRFLVPGLEAILLIGLAITTPRHNRAEFRRRRRFAIGLIALVSAANALSLAFLVEALLEGAKTSGRNLLFGALMIWLTNIIIFALWYWELDGRNRGSGRIERTIAPGTSSSRRWPTPSPSAPTGSRASPTICTWPSPTPAPSAPPMQCR